MESFTVSFFGHRRLDTPRIIEQALENLVKDLLLRHEYLEFLVGRDGDFDLLVASVIQRCRKMIRSDNSSLVLVLPYQKAEIKNSAPSFLHYYDEIELCPNSASVHFKAAYQCRNRAMVDRSQLVVFCVGHKKGGAYQTLLYAQKSQKEFFNILSSDLP